MSQHDTLTRALQQIADWNSHATEYAVDYGSNGVRDFYRNIARAALSATQPAQAAQGEPFGFVHHYVAHDSQGRIIDSTWEADGCEDEMPHPTHLIKWRWERSEPFYTKTAVAQGAGEVDTGPRVLREVLSVCEDTMDKMALETTEFSRGRAFEAKGISRAIGTWFQDEFCGLSHMGEPVAAPTQPAAGADVLDAQRYRMVRRGQHWSVINGIGDTLRGEDLDAAIDAAIAASGRQE